MIYLTSVVPSGDMTDDLEIPAIARLSLVDAIRFGSGYSSRSLVSYICEDLSYVTPAAYSDYIEGKNWPELLERVRKMLSEQTKEEVCESLHHELVLVQPKLVRQVAQSNKT